MSTVSTFGISFGGDALQPIPATRREKQDHMTRLEEARLAALDVRVRGWSGEHDLPDLEAMNEVLRAYRQENYAPVRISTADLGRRLKTDEADAAARLERLIRSGAVERIRKIAAAPTYRTNERGPVAVVTKQERDMATIRDMAEDALRASKGQEPMQRAKAQTSTFPAGSVMRGLQGRH